jgi:hypothetical protein
MTFPEIEDWYVPSVTDTGAACEMADYAVGATNGCSRAEVWEDPNSVYVSARNEIDHSVVIGGGEYQAGTYSFSNPAASYRLDTWSDKINTHVVKPASVADAGLDLATLKISQDGAVAAAYGAEWVETWNSLVSRDGMGRPDRGDTADLWAEVDRAERVLAGDPDGDTAALESALAGAIEVGEATDSGQGEIDAALAALTDALEPLLPEAPGKVVLSDDNRQDGLRGGSFTVTANMWWGPNGTEFRLYEDGELVEEVELDDRSPKAQRIAIPVEGRPNGTYRYTCELENAGGVTECAPHTVVVDAASPGVPVLSSDNWDRDGVYTVTANMWWGTNATSWVLTEDGAEVASGELEDGTPAAQQVKVPLTGRTSGSHVYVMTFANALGETASKPLTVRVD